MKKHLIVIDGPFASGKTSLGRELSAKLNFPVLSKDEFKECLFDHLGIKGRKWSGDLGRTSYELLYLVADRLLKTSEGVILDAPFNERLAPQKLAEIAAKYAAHTTLIHLNCSQKMQLHRAIARVASGERHPGHYNWLDRHLMNWSIKLAKYLPMRRLDRNAYRPPMQFGNVVIEINTDEFGLMNVDDILRRVRIAYNPTK